MYENFKYISPEIERDIETEFISGARVSVIHKGKTVYDNKYGYSDIENGISMKDDTIFRLFSMTKPVTAVAAMILLERGRIELRNPVKWFLPTFDKPMILDGDGLRPASRDITIGDLLTMTSGIPYPDGTPAGMKMGELWGGQSYEYLNGGKLLSTVDFALEMGKRPLAFEPGERWMYGASADIMGAVIEVVSGMKYSEFLKKEIFEPLGMNDTGFFVPEDKYPRLSKAYCHKDGKLTEFNEYQLCLTDYRLPPSFESGGAGLVSTIGDYAKFVKMLMGKGTYTDESGNKIRILGRKTVETLSMNCLNEQQMKSLDWDSLIGHGYGHFMRVLTDRNIAGRNGTEGEYGWDGWMGCYFSLDPSEELAILYFIQLAGAGTTPTVRRLQNIVWGSVD